MIKVTVNAGPVQRVMDAMRKLKSKSFLAGAVSAAATAVLAQAKADASRRISPYGDPWPRARFDGAVRTLGSIPSSLAATVRGLSFRIGTSKPFAKIHQKGAVIRARPGSVMLFKVGGAIVRSPISRIPARPFLIKRSRGLGSWGKPMQEAISGYFRKAISG